MDEFKKIVKAVAESGCKRCKCPICNNYINLKINGFTGGIQSMCERCGKYWIEDIGGDSNAERN